MKVFDFYKFLSIRKFHPEKWGISKQNERLGDCANDVD